MSWHGQAEGWALQHVSGATALPVVFLTPSLAPAVAGAAVFVGPAAMDASTIRHTGALTAEMRCTVSVRAAGSLPADLEAMTAATDAIVAALARGGARSVATAPGALAADGSASPIPARTITATIAIEGDC